MNTNINIYSFGYWGYGGDAAGLNNRLLTFNRNTRNRGIIWVDLRIRRSVRAKEFIGDKPRQLFGAENYFWIQEFGNLNILGRGSGVKIKDYEAGYAQLLKALDQAKDQQKDLILFCACENVSECHRNNVMQWLKRRIKTDRIQGVSVVGEFPTTQFRSYFDRPEDEARFNRWRKEHPQGFFLNCEPDWHFKLHQSKCHHFGGTDRRIGEDNWSVTRIPKKCDTDRARLVEWAKGIGADVTICTSCFAD